MNSLLKDGRGCPRLLRSQDWKISKVVHASFMHGMAENSQTRPMHFLCMKWPAALGRSLYDVTSMYFGLLQTMVLLSIHFLVRWEFFCGFSSGPLTHGAL